MPIYAMSLSKTKTWTDACTRGCSGVAQTKTSGAASAAEKCQLSFKARDGTGF